MAWIQAHQQLRDHRKLLAAADDLEIEPVYLLGHLISFWLWALDNAPGGSLSGINNRTVARAAQWKDEPDKLVDALTKAKWLDVQPDGSLAIHDWYDYAGKLLDQRENEKMRSRQRRAAATKNQQPSNGRKADDQQTTDGRPTDDRRTTDGRPPNDRRTTDEKPTDDRQTTGGRVEKSKVDKSIVDNKDINPPYPPIKKEPDEQERRFSEFWKLYPKKIAKKTALSSWKRINPDDKLFKQIMQAVTEAKNSPQWNREGGRFIPNPTTWLNRSQWEDELTCAEAASASKTGKPDTLNVLRGIIAGVEGEGGDQP